MLDTGATAFMLVSAMLVFLMTPGVAFFYGGLARRKNVVNTMFMSFVIIGVVAIAWILVGWSLAYGGDGLPRQPIRAMQLTRIWLILRSRRHLPALRRQSLAVLLQDA